MSNLNPLYYTLQKCQWILSHASQISKLNLDYLDVTIDGPRKIHNKIRGSYEEIINGIWKLKEYKQVFKGRHIVEQYFARLGDREVEQTTHYSLNSIKNQMTIAHLTASLIAVAAVTLLGRSDKIRCYRTFAEPAKTG